MSIKREKLYILQLSFCVDIQMLLPGVIPTDVVADAVADGVAAVADAIIFPLFGVEGGGSLFDILSEAGGSLFGTVSCFFQHSVHCVW